MLKATLPCLALSSAALAGCVTAGSNEPSLADVMAGGRWAIERKTDRISDKPGLSVSLVTSRTKYRPPRDIAVATISLICARGPAMPPGGRPTLMVSFSAPVGAQGTTTLEYRFDAKPGREPKDLKIPNYKSIFVTDAAEVHDFISDMHGASQLFVRAHSPTAGGEAEFNVATGFENVQAFLQECPSPGAQRRTSGRNQT